MSTNKRNNKVKEFAVGTRIKYNGKLYEVIENVNCADCSIANICSNNNVDNKTGYGLSVDKRLNIFGVCSSDDRYDSKSVVFVEIPNNKSKDNSKYEYYRILPLFAYNNPTQLRPIELVLPNCHEIDVESSDLSKGIIHFKRKWLNLEQLYKLAKDNNYHTCLSEIKDSTGDKTCEVREKLIALANLMDIARYFNGNWKYDFAKEDVGYAIAYYKFVEPPHYSVCKIDKSCFTYYGSPVFKNEADAQYVIDNPNFRDILDIIFKV